MKEEGCRSQPSIQLPLLSIKLGTDRLHLLSNLWTFLSSLDPSCYLAPQALAKPTSPKNWPTKNKSETGMQHHPARPLQAVVIAMSSQLSFQQQMAAWSASLKAEEKGTADEHAKTDCEDTDCQACSGHSFVI